MHICYDSHSSHYCCSLPSSPLPRTHDMVFYWMLPHDVGEELGRFSLHTDKQGHSEEAQSPYSSGEKTISLDVMATGWHFLNMTRFSEAAVSRLTGGIVRERCCWLKWGSRWSSAYFSPLQYEGIIAVWSSHPLPWQQVHPATVREHPLVTKEIRLVVSSPLLCSDHHFHLRSACSVFSISPWGHLPILIIKDEEQ